MGRQVVTANPFRNNQGAVDYYIVNLSPSGFVIIPGDDRIEPIIAFTSNGRYDPSPENCLAALVARDLPGRMAAVRGGLAAIPGGTSSKAQSKWRQLIGIGQGGVSILGISSVSDPRVDPLIQSRWNQSTVCGSWCYNYYTPSHYVCGCVATATAQIMRFHQFPTAAPGTPCYNIWVNGQSQSACLRGGDGAGGPYPWGSMVLNPSANCGTFTTAQRQAIGALCYDAGVAVSMQYSVDGSGAWVVHGSQRDVVDALRQTFGYSNAIGGNNPSGGAGSSLLGMINPNLDAGFPVELAIDGSPGGHAIVADGYGYQASTLYHHLNLGWGGASDAWYNLPTVDTGYGTFVVVDGCVYNIYVTGSGEIISGRVTNATSQPLSGATVTAVRTGGGTYNATTNARGIFVFAKLPSGSTYSVTVQKSGYLFNPQTVTTGTSTDNGNSSGNKWGINFTGAIAGPTCHLTFSPPIPLRNQTVTFDSEAVDLDGYIVSVNWTFGDGATGTGITTTHSYEASGVFTVSCTVTGHDGLTAACSTTVPVELSGNDFQWNIKLNLYTGSVGGSPMDTNIFLGVRSGSTDGYDSAYDSAHAPVPMPPYVYLAWYRPSWTNGTDYRADYRAAISSGQGKMWQDLRVKNSQADTTLWLNWVIAAGGTAWQVSPDYLLSLYDEGTAPNPTGGILLDMWLTDRTSFSHAGDAEIHYFHLGVHHGPLLPPSCAITSAPAAPECQQSVAFDSHAADADGSVVSVVWNFGDGTTGTGLTAAHTYDSPGSYAVSCTVTDNEGVTGDCNIAVTVIPSTISFTLSAGGWHMFSLPCDPLNPAPEAVFAAGTILDGVLVRFEEGGYVTYQSFDPPEVFGPMEAGVGYWIHATAPITISYQACCPPVAQALSYAASGWHLMGGHQPGDISLFNCSVRNELTGQTLPLAQAWTSGGWVMDPLFSFVFSDLGYLTCGVDFSDDDSSLRQYAGYWFYTIEPLLTLIVPAP